ncbi:hypothetical protein F9L33_09605 [Amylibacter sp. SFDW26]|uniref:hypothetical protein n=1 Tax=Amylibacter sp. SFDW26 TaxID=2652722 RepID=UPI0012619D6F|nr:hypothetical protein [Amylibacter sp. SFDW26]KAB7613624.1 hypothetical protein F9L33_09605 [Amylibacter sp. SFDW26]
MKIRQFISNDLAEVVNIEKTVWKEEAANEDQIMSRHQTCCEGSVVAETNNGEIVGYAAAQRVSQLSNSPWAVVTDDGFIKETHQVEGKIAFGVGMSVLQSVARFNVSGLIVQKYAQTFVSEGGCHLMALGSRLPGYSRWHEQFGKSVQVYLDQARKGYSIDPELYLYQRAGFKLLWPVEDYFNDPQSLNLGAMIAMSREAALRLTKK